MPYLRTFIVEDSPIIQDALISALEEFTPVQVVGTAVDEPTAVAWMTEPHQECDLMIIDVILKSGSGLGVLQSAARHGVPGKRVVLTNYASPEMRKACTDMGADRVFDKSQELEELMAYCARLAEGRGDSTPGALR